MNSAEIQIQFTNPGNWKKFILTAIYPDKDGYTRTDRYTAREIPADQAPAMQAVVAALVGLSEPWQASQVWAQLGVKFAPTESNSIYLLAVELFVEAFNAQGGRRLFTTQDYPEFVITDPAAVAFFKYFTKQ
ncbi:hypothetical protein [Akkermansia sp.]|uniref:hypothetical protein n=1 Tax=Akkermansia sp. TaxID=1872421 RepID=UPI0025BC18A9|nr:hypothetical protein [Akkermansia sp.]MCD8063976.1 hypothetical protein [Akkermansia sp.]